ncbi:MAG: hypothetical protein Q9166_002558 [cf. Caloplaca sp. 2 TL-2023]
MGCDLIDQSTYFRSVLQDCENALKDIPDPPSWSIIDELSKVKEKSNINDAKFSQPLCTALQIGIVSLLRSWGVRPTAVVGHSSGEIAAAFAAGMISLRSAIIIAYYRGYILGKQTATSAAAQAKGSMCAVGMSEAECKSLLGSCQDRVQLAAVNSPQSCTLSGDREDIQKIIEICVDQGRFCRQLTVDQALTVSLGEHLEITCVLEIGPHPALKGPTQETLCCQNKACIPYFSTCMRNTSDFDQLLNTSGLMIAAGVPLDTRAINAEQVFVEGQWRQKPGSVLTDLPTYRWNHTASFWSESRMSRNVRYRQFSRHELLGSRYVDDIPCRACWRNQIDPDDISWLDELKCVGLPGLSPAMCILMAIEAARQTLKPNLQQGTGVKLTDVRLHEPLLHPVAVVGKRTFETQFISNMQDDSSRMTFEIFRASLEVADDWQLCATGIVESASPILERSANGVDDLDTDPLLLQRARKLYPYILSNIENLQMRNGKIRGDTLMLKQSWQGYPLHPVALASVLSLGPTSKVDQSLPVKYRILYIPMLEIGLEPQTSTTLSFNIESTSTVAGGALSMIVVNNGIHTVLTGTVQDAAVEIIPPKPITESLFFKPVFSPDITKHIKAQAVSIAEFVQLLTHKWLMSDIVIGNVSAEAYESIVAAVNAPFRRERKRFRSVLTLREPPEATVDDPVKHVRELPSGLQAHVIFAGRKDLVQPMFQYLGPAGLVCHCGLPESSKLPYSNYLEYVCQVAAIDESQWSLYRKKKNPPSDLLKRQRIVFSDRYLPVTNFMHVSLQVADIESFIKQPGRERFDAILIDSAEESIVTTWSGESFIPWLQYLMKHADSLLWVTLDASSSPFVDIAGTLLRTLQAEQPSLKVSWLCLDETQMDVSSLVDKIESAYASVLQGENEARLDVDPKETRIIRYVPDEHLAAATGVALPRRVDYPIDNRDYTLALVAPYEPVLLSHKSSSESQREEARFLDLEENFYNPKVRVSITASVITGDDVAAYKGRTLAGVDSYNQSFDFSNALGTFFAGVVSISGNIVEPGYPVVGWTTGAHVNEVDVLESNIFFLRKDQNHLYGVACFASLATAMAVLDGHIRARENDNLHFVNIGTMLHEAFDFACDLLGVCHGVGNSCDGNSPTFVIEISEAGQVLVDKAPVNVRNYLATHPSSLSKLWQTLQIHNRWHLSEPQCFPFKSYKEAFEAATTTTDLVVLMHDGVDGISHVPIYRCPNVLFTPSGAYIIIGGLGGLGRYTCSWLVDHGATTIYAISRSGISSPEAQALYDDLNCREGVTLEVIKADACDRSTMSSILSSIRAKEPIKGVINMAMLLGDAPMASMTGEEWDRALKVKIQSSWILHEETRYDELEFFVLFSSIASILGNRNQGSYNVGNTFLNALATYRRREARTAVAIALGAMTDIGVLSTYATSTTSLTLTRSGLTHLTTAHLDKILEAAFYKSRQQLAGKETQPEDAVMVTGLDMWEEREEDGTVYWRGCPEFSHLARYRPSSSSSTSANAKGKEMSLKERVGDLLGQGRKGEMEGVVMDAFVGFLAGLLGFAAESYDTGVGLGTYGLDSLNAVGVQYWCWRGTNASDSADVVIDLEAGVNVSVAEVFGAESIARLVKIVCERVVDGRVEMKDGNAEMEEDNDKTTEGDGDDVGGMVEMGE